MKKLAVLAGIGLLVFLLWPRTEDQQLMEGKPLNMAEEYRMKEATMLEDIRISEEMVKNRIRKESSHIFSQLKAANKQDVQNHLKVWMEAEPLILHLQWTANQHTVSHSRENQNQDAMEEQIAKADEQLRTQGSYESEPFELDESKHYAFGLRDGEQAFIGIAKLNILRELEIEQKKNLRIVPYPSDKRMNIQAADADNLKKVDVDHAEENQGVSHYYKDEVIVRFKEKPSSDLLNLIRTDTGAEVQKRLTQGKNAHEAFSYVFTSKQKNADELLAYFKKNERMQKHIQYVEPHFLYMSNQPATSQVPNDTLFQDYQWNLPIIGALEAWNIGKGSDEVIVAVIDSGVDTTHPDLQGKFTGGANMVQEGVPQADEIGHGTHVAGVISAHVNNYEGIAGINWYNQVMPVKVLDHTGAGSAYAVAQGIIWATDQGADVINLSLGNYAQAEFLHDAIKYAYERNVVLVAATGNDNTMQPGYPAAYPEVLAVGASDYNQSIASFSNYGDYVDVTAPGVNIASTYPGGQYVAMSGTSMASPHVAALAAILKAANPQFTNTQIMDMIRETADDLGPSGKDMYFGYGQINVTRALERAIGAEAALDSEGTVIQEERERLPWFRFLLPFFNRSGSE